MKIKYPEINRSLEINKREVQAAIAKEPVTAKLDSATQGTILRPLISPQVAKSMLLQSSKLSKCVKVLAQDTISNNWNFNTTNDNNDTVILAAFWNKYNKRQLQMATEEHYTYGYGCCEVIRNEKGEVARLKQFPAETAHILQKVKPGTDEPSYYVVHNRGGQLIEMRLTRFEYDKEDDDKRECFWLGGGKTEDFYDVPQWLPSFNSISAKISLDELNAKKLNEGNLMSGILVLTGNLDRPTRRDARTGEIIEKSKDELLKEKMDEVGTGLLTVYMGTNSKDIPLKMDYVKISEDNYDYLRTLANDCDQDIMSCFSIPKVRLMIDDVTESMNSNKTDTIWEIYTLSLEKEQYYFELEVDEFSRKYILPEDSKFVFECNMETPIFTDKRNTEIQTTIAVFKEGLLTIGQAIERLKEYFPELDWEKIDTNTPMMNERYMNGHNLGAYDSPLEIEDTYSRVISILQGDPDVNAEDESPRLLPV